MGHSTPQELKVFFRNLNPALLGIKLTNPNSIPHLLEVELLGFVPCKFHDIEPVDRRTFLAVCFQDPWRAVKEPLEAFDDHRTNRAGTKVASHGFMALQDTVVFGDQREESRQSIIGSNQREGFVVLADKIIDVEVGGVGGSSDFGRWRSWKGVRGSKAPLAFLGGGVVAERRWRG